MTSFPLDAPLITDADDVLFDWHAGFDPYARAVLGAAPDSPLEDLAQQERSTMGRMVLEFIASPEFGRMTPYPDALVAMRAAAEQGRPIHVVSACGSDPRTIARREDNLASVFGDIFASITCTPIGGSKLPALQALHARQGKGIFVEDKRKHALSGIEAGHQAFVLRRPSNRDQEAGCTESRLTWVDDWHAIRRHRGF